MSKENEKPIWERCDIIAEDAPYLIVDEEADAFAHGYNTAMQKVREYIEAQKQKG